MIVGDGKKRGSWRVKDDASTSTKGDTGTQDLKSTCLSSIRELILVKKWYLSKEVLVQPRR